MIKKRKLSLFGHVSMSSGLAKIVLRGTVNGKKEEVDCISLLQTQQPLHPQPREPARLINTQHIQKQKIEVDTSYQDQAQATRMRDLMMKI